MDTINKKQQEENHKNLTADEAENKIKYLIDKNHTCFFCTEMISNHSQSNGVRPMSVLKVDDDGIIWFLSANDSHKNKEIVANHAVKLYFQGSAHSDFLFLSGKATITEDKEKIKELWEPILKTWFTEGENDPRISVIKVTLNKGYYWDTKHGSEVAGIKMLIGAAIGKTLDDSIEGKIKI
jgi:general stress protein 26